MKPKLLTTLFILVAISGCGPTNSEKPIRSVAGSEQQTTIESRGDRRSIINGYLGGDFRVAALTDTQGNYFCSATLIGCRTVLTAAHCVEGRTNSNTQVFIQQAGIFGLSQITIHPSYEFPFADVAVLTLGRFADGIKPMKINDVRPLPFNTASTISGFGRGYGSSSSELLGGIKRYGQIVTTSCSVNHQISDTESVCWNFDSAVGPVGTDSTICSGDSGGPLFTSIDGVQRVAGIASGASLANFCTPGDFPFNANVFTYRQFIRSSAYVNALGQSDLDATTCGSLPAVGASSLAATTTYHGTHTGINAHYGLVILPNTKKVRVALNGDYAGSFDLYVLPGKLNSNLATAVCAPRRLGNMEMCEFTNPAATEMSVIVRRVSGSGSQKFQLNITRYN